MEATATHREPDVRAWPVMALFFFDSLVFGNIAVRIPDVMENAGLNKAELALSFTGVSLGSIATLPLAGFLASRLGDRTTLIVGYPLFITAAVLFGLGSSFLQLFLLCLYLGAALSFTELGLNMRASTVESVGGRPIMGKAHGAWTLGVLAGSLAGVQFADAGMSVAASSLACAAVALPAAAVLVTITRFGEEAAKSEELALPGLGLLKLAATLGVGVFIFGFAVAEGAATEWSTLYLREMLGKDAAEAGYAFSLFSAAMAITRFSGDWLTSRFGRVRLGAASAALAALGVAIIVHRAGVPSVMLGFAVLGAGTAMGYPLAMSAAKHLPGDTPHNLAFLTFVGVIAFMLGSVAIGFVAEATELRWGLLQLVAVMAASLYCARWLAGGKRG